MIVTKSSYIACCFSDMKVQHLLSTNYIQIVFIRQYHRQTAKSAFESCTTIIKQIGLEKPWNLNTQTKEVDDYPHLFAQGCNRSIILYLLYIFNFKVCSKYYAYEKVPCHRIRVSDYWGCVFAVKMIVTTFVLGHVLEFPLSLRISMKC